MAWLLTLRTGGSHSGGRRSSGHPSTACRSSRITPYEIDLCETLGVSTDEYWEFIHAAQEHVQKRGDEYELVPDVRNDPVSILVTLAIGVALSAVGALLAPKPAQQKQDDRRADLKIDGSRGKTRYTRSQNFDSVQQLASLGQLIR